MRLRHWGLGAGAMMSALLLAGCHGDDGSFSVTLHGSPSEVLNAIDDPSVAQVESLLPQARVIRSRPSDSELLFTIPGDEPGHDITVRFTMTPLGGDQGTQLVTALHVPPVVINLGAIKKQLSENLVEQQLRKALTQLASDLDKHQSSLSTRAEISGTLTALAIANHKALIEKILSGKQDELMRRMFERLSGWEGGADLPGEGHDPTPREQRVYEPTPDNDARGVDPTPEYDRPAEARPMVEPTGTSPNPY